VILIHMYLKQKRKRQKNKAMYEDFGLQHEYIKIEKDHTTSFGGSQAWFYTKSIQKSGCGRIAGQDLALYLGCYHPGSQTPAFRKLRFQKGCITWESYERYSRRMRKWFPVIPYLGMPGWFLPVGLNLYFRKYHVPYRVRWGVLPGNLLQRIEEMLKADIPVILAVGQNFPFFWGRRRLTFYQKKNGRYEESVKVKAHYVTVTHMQGKWLTISSWGKEYYINWDEYLVYVKKYSSYLFSNICYVYKRT
jgi:hypothetical protein